MTEKIKVGDIRSIGIEKNKEAFKMSEDISKDYQVLYHKRGNKVGNSEIGLVLHNEKTGEVRIVESIKDGHAILDKPIENGGEFKLKSNFIARI
jgi:hypothetical protein